MSGNFASEWNGDKIRELRGKLGWCQTDLARHMGVSLLEITRLEDDQLSINGSFSRVLFSLNKLVDKPAPTTPLAVTPTLGHVS